MQLLPNISPEKLSLDNVCCGQGSLVANATELLIFLAGAAAIIYAFIGAFWYFTAFGSEEKANKGKTTLMWAVIGIVVILLSRVIMQTVQDLLK